MALTDHDREYMEHLIKSQTGEFRTDMRWVKLLAGFAMTCFGATLTFVYPIAQGIHDDVEVVKGKIAKYESDHLKCHRWNWRDDDGRQMPVRPQ